MNVRGRVVLVFGLINFLFIGSATCQELSKRKVYSYTRGVCISPYEQNEIYEQKGFFPECALDTLPYINESSLLKKNLKNKNFLLILNELEKANYYNYSYEVENITVRRLQYDFTSWLSNFRKSESSKGLRIDFQIDADGKIHWLYIKGKGLSKSEEIDKDQLFLILDDSKWTSGFLKKEKVSSKFSFLFEIND